MKKLLLSLCLVLMLSSVCRSEVSLSTTCLIDLTNWTTVYIDTLYVKELRVIVSTIIVEYKYMQTDLYFSPYDNCEKVWVDNIIKASSYVYISCFGISNDNIFQALVNKRKEGVRILICIDKLQSGAKKAKEWRKKFEEVGIEYVVKKTGVFEYNKLCIIDDNTALLGSWNLSGNAQSQDNSLIVLKNRLIESMQVKNAILRIYNRDRIIK